MMMMMTKRPSSGREKIFNVTPHEIAAARRILFDSLESIEFLIIDSFDFIRRTSAIQQSTGEISSCQLPPAAALLAPDNHQFHFCDTSGTCLSNTNIINLFLSVFLLSLIQRILSLHITRIDQTAPTTREIYSIPTTKQFIEY